MKSKEIMNRYEQIEQGFWSTSQAKTWEEALISGNGTLGAMVMGNPYKETLIFNHEELFLPLFMERDLPDIAPHLTYIRELIARGEYKAAMDFVIAEALKAGYPRDFLMTDPYHPAFDLLVDMGPEDEYTDYQRRVDFSSGEAVVSWQTEAGLFLRRLFVSRKDRVIVFSIIAPQPGSLNVRLQFGTRPAMLQAWDKGSTSAGYVLKGRHFQSGIKSVAIDAKDDWLTYRSAYAKTAGGYEGVGRVVVRGGTMETEGNELVVVSADELLVVVDIASLKEYHQSQIKHMQERLSALPADYDVLLKNHVEIHGEIFSRVKLDLSQLKKDEEKQLSIEELMARSQEEFSMTLLEKAFDAARYNIISSSGALPPNLQGVWNARWDPYWSGDYTLDANLQAATSFMLTGNFVEGMIPLFDLLESMQGDMRENARKMFGCRGFLMNSRTSTHGLLQRYNSCPMYFWTAGAAWFCSFYYDYWLFTGDRKFLQERAIPFMLESALFFEDFMTLDEHGFYQFSPSVSPENQPLNSNSLVSINATMDVAAVKELLRNLVRGCQELGIERENVEKWEMMLARMPVYIANTDGALQEWTTSKLEDNYAHRHMSHLYPLYPAFEATPDGNPTLFEMCKTAVYKRLEQENLNVHTGFGLYHVSLAASRCRDAKWAFKAINHLVNHYFFYSMATSHDRDQKRLNMDASGGLPAAIIEMLVISQSGKIDLFPALPAQLGKGRIKGIRCRGQIELVTLAWDLEAKEIDVHIRSDIDQRVSIHLPYAVDKVKNALLEKGEGVSRTSYAIDLKANEDTRILFYIDHD